MTPLEIISRLCEITEELSGIVKSSKKRLNAQKWRRRSKRNSGTWSMRQTGNWMSLSTT